MKTPTYTGTLIEALMKSVATVEYKTPAPMPISTLMPTEQEDDIEFARRLA